MKQSQEILFSNSPNSDDDVRIVGNGDFRYAIYLRSGTIEAANQYARESYLGNSLIVNNGLAAGTNRIIEACPNIESKAIMFRIYNSNGNHSIWQLNTTNNSFVKVIQTSFLNFTTNDWGWSMFVNNGILYWTTGIFSSYINSVFSEPKQIDIAQAIAFTAGAPSKYVTLSRRTFDFVKWPPAFGPDVTYSTDSTQLSNFLWGKLYKFRYRYIYINNEESALSPYSRLALPTTADFAQGRDYNNTQADNIVNVTINTGPDIVAKIEVLVSVNDGPWWVYDQIDKTLQSVANNTTYTSVYNGNEALLPVSLVQRNYDRVPLTARNMTITPDRKIVFGDYVEGYNKQATAATIEAIPVEITGRQFAFTNIFYGANNEGFINTDSFITTGNPAVYGVDVFVQEGDTMSFVVGGAVPDQTLTYVITAADVALIAAQPTAALRRDELLTIVGTYISSTLGIAAGALTTVAGFRLYEWSNLYIFLNLINNVQDTNISYYSGITQGGMLRLSNSNVGLFKGATHEYGKQYYDRANRDGTVLTSTVLKLYVPFDTEQDKTDFQDVNDPFYTYARTTDNDTPPDWATHYQWVKRRVPVLSFRETTGLDINTDTSEPGLLKIELDSFLNAQGGSYGDTINVGDIVRLIRQGTSTSTIGQYINEYIELQVMKYDASLSPGGSIWVPYFDATGIVVDSSGFVLQIYTPGKLDEQAVWHEIGEEYLITNPHTTTRRHAGSDLGGTVTNLSTGSPNFDLEAALVGPNGGNFEYIIGRSYIIVADVLYTGTIVSATYNPATRTTAVVGSANFTGANTSGSIQISLNQTAASSAYASITFTPTTGLFAVGDTVTDSINGAAGTLISITGNTMIVLYTTVQAFLPTDTITNGTGATGIILTVSSTGLPAIVNMVYGDTYTRTRAMSADSGTTAQPRFYTIDDFGYSDFYPSSINSQGRIAIELPDARQIRQQATVIHGGAYIDNTEINNLCRFDQTDISAVLAMDEQYGPINKLVMMDGYTLKCIQDQKENSVYIKATLGISPGGGGELVFSPNSQTFGGWNQMKEAWGTIHPFSVRVAEGRMYYYDNIHGTVVRSANNGQDDICQGKYKYRKRINQFKQGVDALSSNAWVSSLIDDQNNEYQLSVMDIRSDAGRQGLVFRYDLDKWDHEVTYGIYIAANFGNYLVSVPRLTATVYQHGVGAMNTFYGTIYPSVIEYCFNDAPLAIKVLLALGLRTDKEWTVSSVLTEANESYPVMQSEILAAQWELREGYYWANFLRDKLNVVTQVPSLATTQLALINGRQLRGSAATITMSYTPTTGLKVKLFSASVKYTVSPPNI